MGYLNRTGGIQTKASRRFYGEFVDYEVQAACLDSLGLPSPDVIKIDVEGAEDIVLEGARDSVLHAKPTLLIETHGVRVATNCAKFLVSSGYACEILNATSQRPIICWQQAGN